MGYEDEGGELKKRTRTKRVVKLREGREVTGFSAKKGMKEYRANGCVN